MDMEILSEEMLTYAVTNELDYSDSNAQAEAQKAYIENLREKAAKNGGSLEISTSTNDGADADKAKVQIDKRNLIITGPNQEGEPCKEIYDDKSNLTFSKNEKTGVERRYNYDEEGKCTGGEEIIPDGDAVFYQKLDALGKYVLDEKEQECAKDLNLDINSLSAAQILQIRHELMYKKPQPKQEEENKEQKEEKPNLNVEEENCAPSNEETQERYENPEAEAIFRKYAAEKGYDFTINENDTEALSGEFSKDGIGKGRVRVKDDSATSDIEGIEALVYYANEKGMSITLGNCTPEYKAEMEKFCTKMGVDLLYSQPALEGHQEEQALETPEPEQAIETPKPEPAFESNPNPTDNPIDVEENKEFEMPTYKINPLKAQMDLKKYLRDAAKDSETFNAVLEGKAENYKEGLYDDMGPEVKEKACADILLRQYAAAFVKEEGDENLQKLEMALKMYGLESITIDPKESEGKVTITTKNFQSREGEEMAQIKVCHDALVPSKKVKANTSDNDRYFNSKGSDRDR